MKPKKIHPDKRRFDWLSAAMQRIQTDAQFLLTRADVDSTFYRNIVVKQTNYIQRGRLLQQKILILYPELVC